MKKLFLIIFLVLFVVGSIYYITINTTQSDTTEKTAKQTPEPAQVEPTTPITNSQSDTPMPATATDSILKKPSMEIDINKKYSAVMHTDKGDVTIELNAKETPNTVNNFVYLARHQFYDGTNFHRIIKNFMIQGGDPKGDGTGGPGYKFDDEPFVGNYDRGVLAMANAGPNTNGSQFFIMHQKNDLPHNYVIFGHVTAGIEVVDKIAESEVTANSQGEPSKPVTPTVISKIDILEQ